MELNPIAVLMEAARGILMHGEWPNWIGLSQGQPRFRSRRACVGVAVVARLAPRYPKLAS